MGSAPRETQRNVALQLVGILYPFTAPKLLTVNKFCFSGLQKSAASIERACKSALPSAACVVAVQQFIEGNCDAFLKRHVDDWVMGRLLGEQIRTLRAQARMYLVSPFSFGRYVDDSLFDSISGACGEKAEAVEKEADEKPDTLFYGASSRCAQPSPTFAPSYSECAEETNKLGRAAHRRDRL